MGLFSIPAQEWLKSYNKETLVKDFVAALIVTVMLIPQSLAYAMLAGLPPEVGLYASMAPLVAYALLGSSRALAVGPVAVVSLMTATALHDIATTGSMAYWQAAIALAFISGCILIVLGLLRAGFLANFLSHSVISGFISAAGILIAAGQFKHIMGVQGGGEHLPSILINLVQKANQTHLLTLLVGVSVIIFLFWSRKNLNHTLLKLGVKGFAADLLSRAGPVAAIALTTTLSWYYNWGATADMHVVGDIPQGLPPLTLPSFDPDLWEMLFIPALLIGIVGFVESVSVGQTLAAKRRKRIIPNQELIALGASNIAASFTGGFPVTGGFARSVVNFDAGAQTPAAGILTAVGIGIACLLLTPALYFLPQATLSATIIVAVLSLVDFKILKQTWQYSRSDFAATALTLVATLLYGVEIGLIAGVSASIVLFLYQTSQPHIAVVGQVSGTEHFRNVLRYDVICEPQILSLRVDESLYFANARQLEDRINQEVAQRPLLMHVILQCSAVNSIDASALESLEAIDHRLQNAGITLHFSEIKGPVMDRLKKTPFYTYLKGQIFLSHFQAVEALRKVI
jgi:SulP family sulfate permease